MFLYTKVLLHVAITIATSDADETSPSWHVTDYVSTRVSVPTITGLVRQNKGLLCNDEEVLMSILTRHLLRID